LVSFALKVTTLSDRLETIRAFALLALNRLDQTVTGVSEEDLDWRACEGANSIRWILTHTAQLGNVYIWKTLADNWGWWPDGWPRNYIDNPSYSLKMIKGDLAKGREGFMEALSGVTEEKLEEEIDFSGPKTREYAVMFIISEVIHHEGQLAHAVGTMKRQRGQD
jgi:uncharacterized damage-inducible protein DinB